MKRVYHTWDKWECYRHGFFDETPPEGLTHEDAESQFADFFNIPDLFETVARQVISCWPNSCEHNLTNENLNRVAWLGQAAVCLETGIPSRYKQGYNSLPVDVQEKNNEIALRVINEWADLTGRPLVTGTRNHKTSNMY